MPHHACERFRWGGKKDAHTTCRPFNSPLQFLQDCSNSNRVHLLNSNYASPEACTSSETTHPGASHTRRTPHHTAQRRSARCSYTAGMSEHDYSDVRSLTSNKVQDKGAHQTVISWPGVTDTQRIATYTSTQQHAAQSNCSTSFCPVVLVTCRLWSNVFLAAR